MKKIRFKKNKKQKNKKKQKKTKKTTYFCFNDMPVYKLILFLYYILNLYSNQRNIVTINMSQQQNNKDKQKTSKDSMVKNNKKKDNIEDEYSDDEGSCPSTCACKYCDTKDPVNWGYNKKGQYVYMSSDDDFEQDEHGNNYLKE